MVVARRMALGLSFHGRLRIYAPAIYRGMTLPAVCFYVLTRAPERVQALAVALWSV